MRRSVEREGRVYCGGGRHRNRSRRGSGGGSGGFTLRAANLRIPELTRHPDRRGHTRDLPWGWRGDVACLQSSYRFRFPHHQDGSAGGAARNPTGMGRNDPAPPIGRGPGVLGPDAQRASGVGFDGTAHGTRGRGRAGRPLPRESRRVRDRSRKIDEETRCSAPSFQTPHRRHAPGPPGDPVRREKESHGADGRPLPGSSEDPRSRGPKREQTPREGSRNRSQGGRRTRHVIRLQESDPRLPPPRGSTQRDRS